MFRPKPPELFCAALYTLTGGTPKDVMVTTMADRLDIPLEAAETLAADRAARGWLQYLAQTVALSDEGFNVARMVIDAASTPDQTRR